MVQPSQMPHWGSFACHSSYLQGAQWHRICLSLIPDPEDLHSQQRA